MEEAKIIRFLIRRITFFRNLIFILDGSDIIFNLCIFYFDITKYVKSKEIES